MEKLGYMILYYIVMIDIVMIIMIYLFELKPDVMSGYFIHIENKNKTGCCTNNGGFICLR